MAFHRQRWAQNLILGIFYCVLFSRNHKYRRHIYRYTLFHILNILYHFGIWAVCFILFLFIALSMYLTVIVRNHPRTLEMQSMKLEEIKPG